MFIVIQSAAYGSTVCHPISDRIFELAFELFEEGVDEDETDAFLDNVCDDYSDEQMVCDCVREMVVDILEDNLSKEAFYSGKMFFYESSDFSAGLGKTEQAAKLAFVNGLIGE